MTKPMTYKAITRALREQGCTSAMGKGDHEKWFCPCGQHMTVITKTREVSPGLVRQAQERMKCLPEGWL